MLWGQIGDVLIYFHIGGSGQKTIGSVGENGELELMLFLQDFKFNYKQNQNKELLCSNKSHNRLDLTCGPPTCNTYFKQ